MGCAFLRLKIKEQRAKIFNLASFTFNLNNMKEGKTQVKVRSYLFAIHTIKAVDSIDWKDQSGRIIAKQLIRSSTSIGANIVEAQAGSSRKDFRNFLNHSLKSANETKFWLALLRDTKKLERSLANKLLEEVKQIANILGASIKTLKNNL